MVAILCKVKHWFFKPRITVLSKEETCISVESDEEMRAVRDGTVSILDNQVYVTNPDAEGSFPTITIPKDARICVTVDGQKCVGRMIVHEGLNIHISMEQVPGVRTFSTRVSKDAMTVFGRVDVVPGKEYHVKDLQDVRHAVIEIEGREVNPASLEVDQMKTQLENSGYRGEVDESVLRNLCDAKHTTEQVILRGIPATPGKSARYRPVELPKIYDPVHRRMRISTVPLGTTVAILEPEIPGAPGRDVFGREVPCPKHRPLPVLGQGVVDVNGRIVATREGRFLLTRNRIDVVPELLIPHDLSSKDGKIEFDGNVVVLGSVLDGSFINASGSVEVHGSVLCSTVMGEHGVYIANAIVGSEVIAGQSKFLYAKLYSVVKGCLKDFLQFRTEYKEVVDYVTKHRPGEVRIPSIANMLLSKRHSNLERSLMELGSDSHRLANTDERYKQIVVELRSKWSGIGRTNIHERDIDLLYCYLKDYAGYVESMMSADLANVKSASVTSSSIRASGKIVITGAGVYASSFEAGDSIVVRRIVRGGFLVAKNLVHVDELGTPSGTETSVKVLNPAGKVRIRMRHPNTLIQVGDRRDRNIEAEVNAMWRGKGHANPNASRRRLA